MSGYRYSIELTDIRFHAFIGVMDQERIVGNEFRIDLSLDFAETDAPAASESEEGLSATVSYADVYAIVEAVMKAPRKLLETVGADIVESLTKRFLQIEAAKVRVEKVTPPIPGITGSAAVTLYWHR